MNPALRAYIGSWPYRLALAGGWIDQPSINMHNRDMYGSMVTVRVAPDYPFMDRSGIGCSTRRVALKRYPMGPPEESSAKMPCVAELYALENVDKPADPSGSQDAVGIVYKGINRLDYGRGDRFPKVVPAVEHVIPWLERVLHLVPIGPRPEGYNPKEYGVFNTSEIVTDLGRAGKMCFEAIQSTDISALAESFKWCSELWRHLMPGIYRHPSLTVNLYELLTAYQAEYPGVMLSGCGGGYLIVASESYVRGASKIRII